MTSWNCVGECRGLCSSKCVLLLYQRECGSIWLMQRIYILSQSLHQQTRISSIVFQFQFQHVQLHICSTWSIPIPPMFQFQFQIPIPNDQFQFQIINSNYSFIANELLTCNINTWCDYIFILLITNHKCSIYPLYSYIDNTVFLVFLIKQKMAKPQSDPLLGWWEVAFDTQTHDQIMFVFNILSGIFN